MSASPRLGRRMALLAVVAGALFAAPAGPAQARPAAGPAGDSGNLLVNPGFEGPYVKQCCHTEQGLAGLPIDEIQVAPGWLAWWYPPGIDAAHPEYCGEGTPDECQAWHRPEWREAAPFAERIHSGGNAQKYFTFYSVHEAGMFQQVPNIPPGSRVQFSVYMHAWSTNDDGPVSRGQDFMGMKVGIDPTGGANPWSPGIVWSPVRDAYDVYQQYTVEAVAQANTVTVFTHSQPLWGYKHNDVYLDDASLIVLGDYSPPAPAPGEAGLPAAAAPPGGDAGQGVAWSANDFPDGAETYTVQAGDTLWVIAAKNGLAVDELRRLNHLSGNKIYVGQVLALSLPGEPTAQPPTPAPTARPTRPATTLAQAPAPAAEYTGPAGNLCVAVYSDSNGDGAQDAAEAGGPPPDLGLDLVRLEAGGAATVGGYRTAGGQTDYCFPNLPPAAYQLALSVPAGYTLTTPADAPVNVLPGADVQVQVGLAPAEVVAALRARTRALTLAGLGLGGLLAAYGAAMLAYRRRAPAR